MLNAFMPVLLQVFREQFNLDETPALRSKRTVWPAPSVCYSNENSYHHLNALYGIRFDSFTLSFSLVSTFLTITPSSYSGGVIIHVGGRAKHGRSVLYSGW